MKPKPNTNPFQQGSKPKTFSQLVNSSARSSAAKKGWEKRRGK